MGVQTQTPGGGGGGKLFQNHAVFSPENELHL